LAPRKIGPPPGLPWAALMRAASCRRRLAALLRLAQAAGDQHHRLDGVGFDDLVDQFVHGAGRHGDDEHVQLAVERLEALDALHAVDLGLARLEDQQLLLRIAAAHQVAQDDAAEVHAVAGDADDADALRVDQLVDLGNRPRQAAGLRRAERALSRRAPSACRRLESDSVRAPAARRTHRRVARREGPRQLEQPREAGFQRGIRQRLAIAAGDGGELLIRQGALKSRRKSSASVSAAAAYTEARSRRKLPSSSSASMPPRPALMTMPNSRVLFRLMRTSTAPAGAAASKARPRPSSSDFNSPASSVLRPCPAAWRNSSAARDIDGLLTLPSSLMNHVVGCGDRYFLAAAS
jgi:hypothetical protein